MNDNERMAKLLLGRLYGKEVEVTLEHITNLPIDHAALARAYDLCEPVFDNAAIRCFEAGIDRIMVLQAMARFIGQELASETKYKNDETRDLCFTCHKIMDITALVTLSSYELNSDSEVSRD